MNKNDTSVIEWAKKIHNIYIKIGRWEICFQPVLRELLTSDLVIVEMRNQLILNYLLILLSKLKIIKLAFWGHGKNFQATKLDSVSEWLKKFFSRQVDWWFAYNDLSASIIERIGFPKNRISSVQNSIDTNRLREELSRIDINQKRLLIDNLHISSENIGLYVGGMYPEKRIKFLEESLYHIRERIPDFEMIFIGSGLDAYLVKEMAINHSWIHYLGPKFDNEKIIYFSISKCFLMPGLVGLAILDCFALGLPLITIADSMHSPEIEYLVNNENGIMLEKNTTPKEYADAAIKLLSNEFYRETIVEGCISSSKKYSLEKMVELYSGGILSALSLNK